MNKKKFAELLAALISSHGMTPEELAEKLGIEPEKIKSYISGEKQPDYRETTEIVHGLGMTMDDFDRMYSGRDVTLCERESSPEMERFFAKRTAKGKRIVIAVIVIEMILPVLMLLLNFKSGAFSPIYLVTFGFMAFLMYEVYHGKKWAIITFVVTAVISAIRSLVVIFFSLLSSKSTEIIFYEIAFILVQCIIVFLLFGSKYVSEFFDEQRRA